MMRVRSGSNSPVGRGLPGRLTAASEPGIRGQGYNPGWWQQLGAGGGRGAGDRYEKYFKVNSLYRATI